MKLELIRKEFGKDFTMGELLIDGVRFCDTVEDEEREVKVMHETCIPKGKYEVAMTYSNKYKRFMPLVMNVPGFEGIRIHSGNTDDDSSGCILLGQRTGPNFVAKSRDTIADFYKRLEGGLKVGKVFIEIKNAIG